MKNEPAFPVTLGKSMHYGEHARHDGLTKREYFAGLAMQGLLANGSNRRGLACDQDETPTEAIKQADALIAELEKING